MERNHFPFFNFNIFSDYDIVGRRVFSNGTLIDSGAYLITSFVGNQEAPDIAFNPNTNTYVCIFQYADDRGTFII